MLRLKEPYKTYGWSCFPHCVTATRDAIECPSCGAPLPDLAGKVLLVDHALRVHEQQPRLELPRLERPKKAKK